ncbi:hypothetical protein [Paenibacillus sp. SER-28]
MALSKRKFFNTSLVRQYIDVMKNGIAHESKVGYTSLTSFVSKQIQKDAELIRTGDIEGAVWHFYKSGITGKVGATKPLLDMLDANGIKYIIEKVYNRRSNKMDYKLMQPPFEIKEYSEMSKEEAKEHFNWFKQQIPSRLEQLGTFSHTSGL